MFLAGAQLNFFENDHVDLISSHKLFIDNLNNYPKLFKTTTNSNIFSSPHANLKLSYLAEGKDEIERKETDKLSRNSQMIYSTHTKRHHATTHSYISLDNVMIYNNINSNIFVKSVLCDDNMLRLIEKNDYFLRLIRILENIKGKLKIDAIIRPLRIFWVKADYKIIGNILAFIGTGIGLVASIFFKGFNLTDIIREG